MVIDVHTHIFPAEIRNGRQRFFASEPAFALLYRSDKAKMVGATELVAYMDRAGIDQAVVLGFPWRDGGLLRAHNDYLLAAARRFAGRLLPFGCVDPSQPQAPAEVERCLQAGMRGIGEVAFYTEVFDDSAAGKLAPVLSCCREAGVPLLLHVNEPVGHNYPGKAKMYLESIYQVVKDNPENRFILAHWGGGLFFYELLKKEAAEVLGRSAYDTAASPYLYRPEVYRLALEVAGPQRVLLGTDYPLLEAGRYFQEMEAAGLDSAAIEWITGKAAAAWLGLAVKENDGEGGNGHGGFRPGTQTEAGART